MKLVFFVSVFWLIGSLFTFAYSLFLLLIQLLNLSMGNFAIVTVAVVGVSLVHLA